ncbi:hypothetical protein C2134_00530 [Chromobacterium sinusclupearum]|uniref:Uncharacterized protein n=1 Tax=Chromobacterium sinusclupearum TaxID=2077146 RepID=A0A2K4MU21_9NEIS|nr:hypothetical protein C2134_00530 [Chromobacterium sinusclupearum]
MAAFLYLSVSNKLTVRLMDIDAVGKGVAMRQFCYVVAGLLGWLGAMAQVDAAQSCRGQSESATAS